MNLFTSLLVLIVQVIITYMLELVLYFVGIGNQWELVALPLVCTVSVCCVGWTQYPNSRRLNVGSLTFIFTLIGSTIGIWLILQIGAVGLVGLFLLPLLGALFGYYFARSATEESTQQFVVMPSGKDQSFD